MYIKGTHSVGTGRRLDEPPELQDINMWRRCCCWLMYIALPAPNHHRYTHTLTHTHASLPPSLPVPVVVQTDIDDTPPDPSRPLSAPQMPPRAKVRPRDR